MKLVEVKVSLTVLYEVSDGRPFDEIHRLAEGRTAFIINELLRDHVAEPSSEDIRLVTSVHAESGHIFSNPDNWASLSEASK